MAKTVAVDSSGYVDAFFQPFRIMGYGGLMLLTAWLTACGLMYGFTTARWNNSVEPAQVLLRDIKHDLSQPVGITFLKSNAEYWVSSSVGFAGKLSGLTVLGNTGSNDPIIAAVSRGIEVTTTAEASVGNPIASSIAIASPLWALKLLLLLSMTPYIVLGYALGYADGLVNREIRRYIVGREQSGLYHRGKFWLVSSSMMMMLFYTTAPVHIPIVAMATIFAVIAFLLSRLQWSNYKKYR